MERLNQRRISDISFVIDKELNVKDGNRSFRNLLHKTDFDLNISYILEESDAKNLRFYLENFDDNLLQHNFIANIRPHENYISCILTITRSGENFKVIIEELSYSRSLLDRALLDSREFSALLQNFDAYYFTYDGTTFVLKNTKDLTTVASGSINSFREFFPQIFKLNIEHDDSKSQFETMLTDIEQFESNRYYSFLQTDKNLLTVHTLKTSTRTSSLIVGSIQTNKESNVTTNLYNEQKDGLTGLYNKKAITELAIKKIDEDKMPCSLIILDADKFKECNDSYGHIFGDHVLVTIASCISEAIKGKGIAGRIGGDEFLIILDLTKEEDIRTVTRNIRMGIQWNITNVEPGSMVTCSMGIAQFPHHAKNYEELFQIADKSLYIAKYRGRNCYIIYKPEIHDKIIFENKQVDDRVKSGKFYDENVSKKLEILEMLTKLDKSNPDSVKHILESLREHLQISKISIYDAHFDLTYIVGVDTNDVRSAYLKTHPNYFKIFNEYHFLHLNNTNILDSTERERYDMYRSINIASILEIVSLDEQGKPRLLICYDLYKPGRSFLRDEVTFALLVSRKLSEIL